VTKKEARRKIASIMGVNSDWMHDEQSVKRIHDIANTYLNIKKVEKKKMTKLQKEIVYWHECGKSRHEIADIADCSSVYVKDTLYRHQKGVWN